MDTDIVKLVSQGGIALAALVLLARTVWRVGERMIIAIDRVSARLDEHTKTDVAALDAVGKSLAAVGQTVERSVSALQLDVARLSTRVDTVIERADRTPVPLGIDDPPSTRDRPHGGEYSQHRPGRRG